MIRGLALAENDLGDAVAQRPMVIDLGESEVFKRKVLQALKDSFAHFRNAVLAIKDSELEKEIKTPRGQTTIRGAFFLISGHYGEHLGQSIAYAREIGVVPPWTEERQRQEAEKPKQ